MGFITQDGIIYRIERNTAFVECLDELFDCEIVIPQAIDDKPIIGISAKAFSGSKIQTVKIPDTIHIINNNAFIDCEELTRVEVYPSTQIKGRYRDTRHLIIGNGAFLRCVNLRTMITTQETVYVGEYAFRDCFNLLDFGAGILHAKKDAFTNCNSLTNLTLKNDAKLWAGSVEKSKVKHLNIWGNAKMTKSVINFMKKNNVSIHCEPTSNVTELIYSGINVSYLY